jgi:hypothetical protein
MDSLRCPFFITAVFALIVAIHPSPHIRKETLLNALFVKINVIYTHFAGRY